MNVLAVSYYTKGEYARHARKLRKSCRKYGVQHLLREMDKFPSWKDAVLWKPEFILDCLIKFRSVDGLLFVDADAEFVAEPDWAVFKDCHVGAHEFKRSKLMPSEVLTGTLFFSQTPTVRDLVKHWADVTPAYHSSSTPEQHSLKDTLKRWEPKILFKDIGPAYCYIFDEFQRAYPEVSPVILHHQASRKLKYAKS